MPVKGCQNYYIWLASLGKFYPLLSIRKQFLVILYLGVLVTGGIMSVGILLLVISVGYILKEMFDTPPNMYYDIWEDEIYYD